jgi:hypothetical protein
VTRVAEHSTTAIINDFIGSPFLVWGRANDHVCYTVGLCAHPRWITAIACRAILAQCRSTRRDPVVNENWSMYEGVSVLVRENNLFQQARDIRDRVAKATPAEWCTVARESADVPRCAEGAQTRAGAMKLSRRTFLHLASGAAMLRAALGSTRAEAYPARPVRIVVGFPPGQSADLIARLLAQWLSEQLVQPFIIDNRPGASNSIAAVVLCSCDREAVTKAIELFRIDRINVAIALEQDFDNRPVGRFDSNMDLAGLVSAFFQQPSNHVRKTTATVGELALTDPPTPDIAE